MKAKCAECFRQRECRKVETDRGKVYLCRKCRKTWRLEYPAGAELEHHFRPVLPAAGSCGTATFSPSTRGTGSEFST